MCAFVALREHATVGRRRLIAGRNASDGRTGGRADGRTGERRRRGLAWLGLAWLGLAWLGLAWLGARLGSARLGSARHRRLALGAWRLALGAHGSRLAARG
ncbi:hypothetical protein DF022_20800 [Burkholderia cepacia]|nr:hypothetical protein DF022_20800 [Burkholderia cepacia]